MVRGVTAAVSTLVLAAAGSRGVAQDAPAANSLEALDRDAQAVMEKASPSVVRVEADRSVRFRVVAGDEEQRRTTEAQLLKFAPRECVAAAGFVVEDGEYVVTTSAAACGAVAIRVTFAGGAVREGSLVGDDPISGAALVRVARVEGAAPLRFSEREPRAGTLTLFLARAGDESPSLQLGFVTAPRRAIGTYDAYITTSLELSPGHAGAPLLDARGDVLGMAVAPRASTLLPMTTVGGPGSLYSSVMVPSPREGGRIRLYSGQESAVPERSPIPATFVPARELRRIVADLRSRGSVAHGYLGVRFPPGTNEPVIAEVLPGTPAARAGLAAGDRFVSVDGLGVDSFPSFSGFIQRRAPGTEVRLVVRAAAGGEREARVVLDEFPEATRRFFQGVGVRVEEKGVVVSTVSPDSIAERAGLREGDVVLSIGGKDVRSETDYVSAATASAFAAGPDGVALVVLRGDEKVALVLK